MLEDGTYDVLVVDADDVAGRPGATHVEVTLLDGPHKGEVVALVATGVGRDPLDLLGSPGTLTVSDGAPSLRLDV